MRHSWMIVGAVVSLTVARAVPAAAQDRALVLARVLTPTRVVRLHFGDGRTATGAVLHVTDSTVAVGACARCSYRIYRVADVAAIDTMIGHPVRAPRVATGALAGGVVAAGAYAFAASNADRGCHDGPCGLWILGVPPTFALGALVGGVIGAFHPYIHWDPVALPTSPTRTAGQS